MLGVIYASISWRLCICVFACTCLSVHTPGPPLFVCCNPWIATQPALALNSPLLLQYIFADAYAQYLWVTFDFCRTVQGFAIPFRAADLLLHNKVANLLLGYDRSHPNKQVCELWGSTVGVGRAPGIFLTSSSQYNWCSS